MNTFPSIHRDPTAPRILTNMAFWQSTTWTQATDSIYDVTRQRDPDFKPWWSDAWQLFRRRQDYDVVLTMGVRESFGYALLCRMFGSRSQHIMTEVFIDPPGRKGFFWKLKNHLYRRLAKHSIGIITNSAAEVQTVADRYDMPVDRLVFVPLNTNIADPHFIGEHDGSILSAGRTQRDYALLVRMARNFPAKFTIICGHDDIPDADIPPNVTVKREADREEYLNHLRRAMIVCLPLMRTPRSTGQVVVLEAMAYGKPVVATRAPGTIDYLVDDYNGCLVEPDSETELAQTLTKLIAHPEWRERLGRQAVQDIIDRFMFEHHAANKLKAIHDLRQKAVAPQP